MPEDNERLSAIEARLAKIEKTLGIRSPRQSQSSDLPPSQVTQKENASTIRDHDVKPIASTGGLLAGVAIICFVLAAGFIIKLSIDSGWLTHARQIGLAYLFGLILILSGFVLAKKDMEYASYLPAAGIIILFITTFAAHQYYHLITFSFALLLITAVSAICMWLYCKFKLELYTIISAAGAYLGPLLLNFEPYAEFSIYYLIMVSIAFAMLSVWMRTRTLCIVAAYLAILANAQIGFRLADDSLIAVVLPIHFFIFAFATFAHSRFSKQLLTSQEAWSFYPGLLLFYAMEYHFINKHFPEIAPWISLLFAAFLLCLYFLAKLASPAKEPPSGGVIIAFTSVVAVHSIYIVLLPEPMRAWLVPMIALMFAVLPLQKFKLENGFNHTNLGYLSPFIALALILLVEYLKLISVLTSMIAQPYIVPITIASFASFWAFILLQRNFILQNEEFGYIILAATHLLVISGLYNLNYGAGSLALSASWLLYAVLVMALAFVLKDPIMARSAVFVLGIAAGKALLYDARAAPTIVRIICLIITGVVLYGAGFLMRIIASWPRAKNQTNRLSSGREENPL